MNRAFLVGNLGKDPELKQTKKGGSVCKLTVATSESIYDKNTQKNIQQTEWHNVTVWGKQAENCSKYLKKGSKVAIEGAVRTESYEKDGIKRWSTKIQAQRVEFLNSHGGQNYDSDTNFPQNSMDETELPPPPEGLYDSIPF